MEDNDKQISWKHSDVPQAQKRAFDETYNETNHRVCIGFWVGVNVLRSQDGLHPLAVFLDETIAEGIKREGEKKRGLDVRDTRMWLAEAARGPLLLDYARR